MTQFNPYEPTSLGLAWQPFIEVDAMVDANAVAVLASTLSEDIDTAWIWLLTGYGDGGRYEMEVWNLDTLNEASFETTDDTCWPGEDAEDIRTVRWDGAAFQPTNLYQSINSVSTTTWIQGGTDSRSYAASFRSADITAGDYAGEMITAVSVNARIDIQADDLSSATMTITPYIAIDGRRHKGETQTVPDSSSGAILVEAVWRANPQTGATWKPEDIDEFADGTGTSSFGWIVEPTGREDAVPRIFYGNLHVFHMAENRAAVSGDTFPQHSLGWVQFDLFEPVSGGPWVKDAGVTYVLILTRWAGTGARAWRFLNAQIGPVPAVQNAPQQVPAIGGTPIPGPPFWTSGRLPGRDDSAIPTHPATDINRSGAYAILLGEGSDISPDSQPYASIYDDGVSGSQGRGRIVPGNNTVSLYAPWTRVQTANPDISEPTQVIEQELTPSVTGDYGYLIAELQIFAADDGSIPVDLEPLRIGVFERGTDIQQGTDLLIERSDLNQSRLLDPQIVAKAWDAPFTLTGGTQYYVRYSTAAVAGLGSWRVQVVSAIPFDVRNPPPAGVFAACFGQGVDDFTAVCTPPQAWDGEFSTLATVARLLTIPDTPTDFVASAPDLTPFRCGPADYEDAVSDVTLGWTPTALGSEFGGYQIERYDEGPAGTEGWQTIAFIDDESISGMTDEEAQVRTAVAYRMRVVRADGSPSLWTDEATVNVTMASAGGLVFSSNQAQGMGLYFDASGPQTGWGFIQDRTVHQFEGRDFQIVVRSAEQRGDEFSRTLIVRQRGVCPPDPTCDPALGRALFDPVLVLTGAQKDVDTQAMLGLPYVCVRDCFGRRWFCDIEVNPSIREEPGQFYATEAAFIEVTRTPYPITVEAPASGS